MGGACGAQNGQATSLAEGLVPVLKSPRTSASAARAGGSAFEQAFKNIDDILHKDAGCTSELDYTEQTSWLLSLKYMDASEEDKAVEAQFEWRAYCHILDEPYRWEIWAAPKTANGKLDHNRAMTGDDLREFVNAKLFPYLQGFKLKASGPNTIECKIGEVFGEIKPGQTLPWHADHVFRQAAASATATWRSHPLCHPRPMPAVRAAVPFAPRTPSFRGEPIASPCGAGGHAWAPMGSVRPQPTWSSPRIPALSPRTHGLSPQEWKFRAAPARARPPQHPVRPAELTRMLLGALGGIWHWSNAPRPLSTILGSLCALAVQHAARPTEPAREHAPGPPRTCSEACSTCRKKRSSRARTSAAATTKCSPGGSLVAVQ